MDVHSFWLVMSTITVSVVTPFCNIFSAHLQHIFMKISPRSSIDVHSFWLIVNTST
jgi:hypothetical protein